MATVKTIGVDLLVADASTLRRIQRMIEKLGDQDDVSRWLEAVNTVQFTGCKLSVKLTKTSTEGTWKLTFETTNTVVPAFPGFAKLLHVDKEDSTRYLNSLKQIEINKDEMENAITKWHNAREKLVNRLREVSDKIRMHRRNMNILRIAGASTSTAGGVMCVITGILSIATLGIATPLFIASVVGTAVGVTGAVTAGAATVIAEVLSSQGAKEASVMIEEDDVTFANLKEIQERYINSLKRHMEIAKLIDNVVLEFKKTDSGVSIAIKVGTIVSKTIAVVKAVRTEINSVDGKTERIIKIVTSDGKLSKSILESASRLSVKAVGSVGIRVVDDVGEATVRALGIASKAVGIAFGAVAIALDIHTIVKSALDLSNNCPDKAADKIEEIAKDLANIEAPTLEELVIESLLAAADEIQIQHEGDINCSEDGHLFNDGVQ